jgi:hypothetical protein
MRAGTGYTQQHPHSAPRSIGNHDQARRGQWLALMVVSIVALVGTISQDSRSTKLSFADDIQSQRIVPLIHAVAIVSAFSFVAHFVLKVGTVIEGGLVCNTRFVSILRVPSRPMQAVSQHFHHLLR